MPFDSTQFDYTKVQPVYDKDNPPKRMSEAIRMAVADVEAQSASGVEYEWTNCGRCTAGMIVRRLRDIPEHEEFGASLWHQFGEGWSDVLDGLSVLTGFGARQAFDRSPRLFAQRPLWDQTPEDFARNPKNFKTDMLALADRLEAEGS